jgi:predicted DNA-binding transcriptional regulator YafY
MLIHLQSKRVVRAEEMADRFEISLRTVYRDVKALMEAGVPIGSEAGKGYFIVDGYHLPPVMFTQEEASAMLLAGKFVEKMTDKSVREAFDSAMYKIKAVLQDEQKEHLESLHAHIEVMVNPKSTLPGQTNFPDHFMTEIQKAVVNKKILQLDYLSNQEVMSHREVEPIGLFYYSAAWHLIAFCRLRVEYRDFRIDRIHKLETRAETFESRNLMTLREYFNSMFENNGLIRAEITFDKRSLQGRTLYGSTQQTDLGDTIKAEFMIDNLDTMARWLLLFGARINIHKPVELKNKVAQMATELHHYYAKP